MSQKALKIAIVGKTNAGKSTLVNKLVGETVSIINKKINTTQELIIGVTNVNNNQLIFYDTPGFNFIKSTNKIQKKIKINLWQAINESEIILFMIDSNKINYREISNHLVLLKKINKKIFIVFNKIDLIEKNNILPVIKKINQDFSIEHFLNISAKNNLGINKMLKILLKYVKNNKWLFSKDEITDKDNIFITNECTRNSILHYLHKELPYNINIKNIGFKNLKNGDLKIKQTLQIANLRYKKIILGKKGEKIKKIRELSQKQISKIFNCKTHLYLEVVSQ